MKICGITDADGILAAVRAGADAIGLNLVPGTPRELALDEAVELRRVARAARPGRPRAARRRDHRRRRRGADRRDRRRARPRRGPALRRRAAGADRRGRPAGLEGAPPAARRIRPTCAAAAARVVELGREHLAAGATRLLLDTAGRAASRAAPAPAPRRRSSPPSPARCRSSSPAASTPANVAAAAPRRPGRRRRRRLGRRAAARRRASARRKDPLQGRAVRQARPRRPRSIGRTSPPGPTPVHPGLLEADDGGRWGDRSRSSAAATSPRR